MSFCGLLLFFPFLSFFLSFFFGGGGSPIIVLTLVPVLHVLLSVLRCLSPLLNLLLLS